MDHIVYLDYKSRELESLLDGTKDIVLRGATGRKLPYNRVDVGDVLYFCYNNAEKLVKAKATVSEVIFTDKLDQEESFKMVDELLPRIKLINPALKRFRGKRYLSIIHVNQIQETKHFTFDKTNFSNMDDWLPVEDIKSVKK